MDLGFTIFVSVSFFSGKRKTAPCLYNGEYSPHLVIKGDDEYLGVRFIDSEYFSFDETVYATLLPIYDGVNYSKLKTGSVFFVMEGSNIVGEGIVDDILTHV